MDYHAHAHDTQRTETAAPRRRACEHPSFKPLAIPALAAAVQVSRPAVRPKDDRRELPPILRKEAAVD